jgi:DNA gyrase inhibitor GyrI
MDKMKMEFFPTYRLAFMRSVGQYGRNNKDTMENIKKWAMKRQLFDKNAIIFGIAQDNPEITPPEKCRYDACIIIPVDFVIDNDVEECEFEGGKYAVFKIAHTAEEIQKAYMEIFELITKGELKMADKPIVERYSMELIENNFCEICAPVI